MRTAATSAVRLCRMSTFESYESAGATPNAKSMSSDEASAAARPGSAGAKGPIPGFMSARRAAILGAGAWIASLWIAIGALAAMIYLSAVKEGENIARDTVFMVGAYVGQTMRSGDLVLEGMRSMLAEQGVTGYDIQYWTGLFLPAKTPDAIVRAGHKAAVAALQTNEVKDRLRALGLQAVGNTPEEFRAIVKRDVEKFRKIIIESGIPRL